MAAVDKESLNSVPWNTVISILEDSSYIDDPRRAHGTRNRKFIYKHEPDSTSFDFRYYPFIVAKCPVKTKSKQSADQSTQEIQWSQSIIVRTAAEGSGQNRDDAGINDMIAIMDQIDRYFESSDVRIDFKRAKLNFQDIVTESAMEELTYAGKSVYETTYTITYRSRVVVK